TSVRASAGAGAKSQGCKAPFPPIILPACPGVPIPKSHCEPGASSSELVRRPVSVIAAMGTASAQAAKAASTTLPIVFLTADDPVKLGLVASLNRPGANLTGVSFVSAMLGAKRLELLRSLVPKADLVAVLVDPSSAESQNQSRGAEEAARALGQQVVFVN